jgi:flagellar biosynthesis/type III secretory pathway chaperone
MSTVDGKNRGIVIDVCWKNGEILQFCHKSNFYLTILREKEYPKCYIYKGRTSITKRQDKNAKTEKM